MFENGSGDTYRLSGRGQVSAPIISLGAMKKYLANTTISVSVTLPNGGNARVSFSPLSDGSSVYYTNDKEIQFALEHHYKFGKLFTLDGESQEESAATAKKSTKSAAKKQQGKKSKKETPEQTAEEIAKEWEEFNPEDEADSANEESEGEEDQEGEAELKEVTVSDLDAAKDYLAENFDIVRTKLKTEEIINDTAASLGVVFKYL